MTPPIPLSEIPTLSTLYQTSKLSLPPRKDASLPPPSETINNKICLIRTDITKLATTCIVNAANESLLGGGGVDGAIHAAAGPSLLSSCRHLNGCATGSAKITPAFELPSQYVIHAVGPIYWRAKNEREGLQKELLRGCYTTALELAAGVDVDVDNGDGGGGKDGEDVEERGEGVSVAFSCLSTGVYGYPSLEAARVACKAVRGWLEEGEGGKRVGKVVFCCFESKDERAYGKVLPEFFPPTSSDLPPSSETNDTPAPDAVSPAPAPPPPAMQQEPETEDLGDEDWEKVENPGSVSAEQTEQTGLQKAAMENAAEGEKVELEGAEENRLGKDW